MTRNDCPECQGTGWKPVEADGVRRVARCTCRETERAEQLLVQARIPRRYEHCAFENFDIRKDKKGTANRNLEQANLWAERFAGAKPLDYGLLFAGTQEAAKTNLAGPVLRELIQAKASAGRFTNS